MWIAADLVRMQVSVPQRRTHALVANVTRSVNFSIRLATQIRLAATQRTIIASFGTAPATRN